VVGLAAYLLCNQGIYDTMLLPVSIGEMNLIGYYRNEKLIILPERSEK
jgi:hypothetical protein